MRLRINIKPKALAEREPGTHCYLYNQNCFFKVGVSGRVTPSDGTTDLVFLGEVEKADLENHKPPSWKLYEMIYKVRSDSPTYDLPQETIGMKRIDDGKHLKEMLEDSAANRGLINDGSIIVRRIPGTPYLRGTIIPNVQKAINDLNAVFIDTETFQTISPDFFYQRLEEKKDHFLLLDESIIEVEMDRDAKE
jgi:hypothetical protein